MREIILINSDGLCSPELCINTSNSASNNLKYVWGTGWYPSDQQSAIVVKDYFNDDSNIAIDDFTDWKKFRSTTFLITRKDAESNENHHDIQPFQRSYAGRDWLFVSCGKIDKDVLFENCKAKSKFLEPISKSASELLFCYLLDKIQKTNSRKIYDLNFRNIAKWLENIDNLNQANILLTDGANTICYRGQNSELPLYYKRISPASCNNSLSSESVSLSFSDPRDKYRTKLIISSSNFNEEDWCSIENSQLLIACRGDFVYNRNINTSSVVPISENVIKNNKLSSSNISLANNNLIIVNTKSKTLTEQGLPLQYKQYSVSHITKYAYQTNVTHSTHKFRMQLVEDHIQDVINSTLEISINGETIQYEDVFGNNIIHYTINQPYNELSITSKSQVKIFASPPDDHSLSRRQVSIPLVWMPWQRQMMTPYLLPVELAESELDELTTYAMSFVERNDYHLVKTLDDINKTIYKDYEYVPGVTSFNTTAFEVFSNRTGVCQDFANLFICLSRLLGIPARYRTGYIFTGGNYENKIQSDASHGWAEVYLPFIGWRGYDPTNGCLANQDHIRVACGRNYIDTTPTSGTIFKGGGNEALSIDVKIEEIQ